MSLPTYESIKDWLETRVDPPSGRPTRSGIRRYLMQVSERRIMAVPDSPTWYRLWSQITWTRWAARQIHVEIPADLWAEDKARLAARIAANTHNDFDHTYDKEKEKALAWTRRRSPSS